jgi:hypothetical protein
VSIPPHHLTYDIGWQDEHILGFGDQNAQRKILLIPPLFDEMNRVRQMLVSAMRDLAMRGVATFLPDLPGSNESLALMPDEDLDSWRAAMKLAANQMGATHIAAIRGGALIDDATPDLPHWRLAPVKGASIIKTMMRARIASDKEGGVATSIDDLMAEARISRVALSGHLLNLKMVEHLNASEPADLAGVRTVTLGDGPDMITGSALWMRAEPQDDRAMSAAIAADLDRWSASCGG